MAKRTKFRNWSEKTEVKSFTVSIVFHCIVLLLLSVIVTKINNTQYVKLTLAFSNKSDDIVQLEDDIVTIKHTEPELDTADTIVEIPLPDIALVVPEPLDSVVSIDEEKLEKQTVIEKVEIVEINTENNADIKKSKIIDDGLDIFGLPKNSAIESSSQILDKSKSKSTTISGNEGLSDKFSFRLSQKNAQTGDVQISILWDSVDDIDLWVEFVPFTGASRYLINWMSPHDAATGGLLDVDCNVSPMTNEPVENIFWPHNGAPFGTYNIYVHYFRQWTNRKNMPVQIRIMNGGAIQYRKVLVSSNSLPIKAYSFTRKISKQQVPTSQ